MLQHITYNEWLPIVLGPRVLQIFELTLRPTGFFEDFAGWANVSREGSAMAIPPARRKFLRVREVLMGFESEILTD